MDLSLFAMSAFQMQFYVLYTLIFGLYVTIKNGLGKMKSHFIVNLIQKIYFPPLS